MMVIGLSPSCLLCEKEIGTERLELGKDTSKKYTALAPLWNIYPVKCLPNEISVALISSGPAQ
jgi:hypothetical protein